jgi:uncharacterized protein
MDKLSFQDYQAQFTAYIRNPALHKAPANVDHTRMQVYRDAVYNNTSEYVSLCFPVCQSVVGKRAWHKLTHQFLAQHAANSPLFREIPQQFLQFLETVTDKPAYLQALAHYEWVELALTAMETIPVIVSEKMDCLNEVPVLAPANQILQYDYPVHQISKRYKPKQTETTYLLVYRNAEFAIKFIEINAVTHKLLLLTQQQKLTGKQALIQLAAEMQHPDANMIVQFGAGIFADLAKQQAIIGSQIN